MNNQAQGYETGPLEACFLYKTEVKNNSADKSKFYVYFVEGASLHKKGSSLVQNLILLRCGAKLFLFF